MKSIIVAIFVLSAVSVFAGTLKESNTDQVKIYKRSVKSKCGEDCDPLYAPICGTNRQGSKLFSSECEMLNGNCQIEDKFELSPYKQCRDLIGDLCFPCPLIFIGVCATNGEKTQLFANKCEVYSRNCQSNENWKVTKAENCSHP